MQTQSGEREVNPSTKPDSSDEREAEKKAYFGSVLHIAGDGESGRGES